MTRVVFSMSLLGLTAGGAFTALLAVASGYDLTTRKIPNRIVALVTVSGIMYALVRAAAAHSTLLGAATGAMLGLTLGLVLWVPFYIAGWLGAGDVKLFAAAGTWLGPALTIQAAIIAALVGGILALVWMLREYGVRGTTVTASVMMVSPTTVSQQQAMQRNAVPYGVALSVGALVTAWTHSGVLEAIRAAH